VNPIKLKVGVIIEKGDSILLIKEKYIRGSAHKWNMITGGWEESDGDIKNTAIRETKEETGLNIKIKRLVQITQVQYPDPEKTKRQFFFVADAQSDEVCLPSKEDQAELNESIIDYKWFEKDEILRMPDEEFVTGTVAEVSKEYIRKPEGMSAGVIKYLDPEIVY